MLFSEKLLITPLTFGEWSKNDYFKIVHLNGIEIFSINKVSHNTFVVKSSNVFISISVLIKEPIKGYEGIQFESLEECMDYINLLWQESISKLHKLLYRYEYK